MFVSGSLNITVLGSCRNGGYHTNRLNIDIHYPHCTKEIIQFIQFLKGNLDCKNSLSKVFSLYNILFHSVFCGSGEDFIVTKEFIKIFEQSPMCIIEISSRKKYIYDNKFYMHHLAVNRDNYFSCRYTPDVVWNNYKIEEQSDQEIEEDILLIRDMLFPKQILMITHLFSSKWLLRYPALEKREKLNSLITKICKKYDICILNPIALLKEYDPDMLVLEDLEHYSTEGMKIWYNYLDSYLQTMKIL